MQLTQLESLSSGNVRVFLRNYLRGSPLHFQIKFLTEFLFFEIFTSPSSLFLD